MSSLNVGQIVQLKDGRKGEVRFIGSTDFSPEGIWVGVELDEPMGKNDGSVAGISYFVCEPNHGLFARPGALTLCEPEPEPPAPAPARAASRTSVPAPARKTSRPSSLQNPTQAGSDTGLKKRMSLNAPSPSPVSKGPRPSSMTRVRVSITPIAQKLRTESY